MIPLCKEDVSKLTAAEMRMLNVEQDNTDISDGITRSESERTSNLKVSSVTVNCRDSVGNVSGRKMRIHRSPTENSAPDYSTI